MLYMSVFLIQTPIIKLSATNVSSNKGNWFTMFELIIIDKRINTVNSWTGFHRFCKGADKEIRYFLKLQIINVLSSSTCNFSRFKPFR